MQTQNGTRATARVAPTFIDKNLCDHTRYAAGCGTRLEMCGDLGRNTGVTYIAKTPHLIRDAGFCVGIDLSSRLVTKQVLSALVSLTSVFGMGTGGPSPLKTPTMVHHQGLEPWTP